MTSRFSAGKTYGRRKKNDQASSAFDEALKGGGSGGGGATSTATKASAHKWGHVTYSSMRNSGVGAGEEGAAGGGNADFRKRPAAEGADSLFDDPFGFDSDDEGPSKPKRGMGFKVNSANKSPVKSYGSKRMKKDENNDEKDTMKRAPSKTYSRGRPSSNQDKNGATAPGGGAKQLSMDAFATKLSPTSEDNSKLTSGYNKAKTSKDNNAKLKPKTNRFFTSKNSSASAAVIDDDGFMFSDDTKEEETVVEDDVPKPKDKTKPHSDFEYDSDSLANLESGDPEIIFNSPQKRRREAAKSKTKQQKNNANKAKTKNNGDSNSAQPRLFADSDDSDIDSNPSQLRRENTATYGMKTDHARKNPINSAPSSLQSSISLDSATTNASASDKNPSLSPSKFFPEIMQRGERSGSVESNGSSTHSATGSVGSNAAAGGKLKKSLSLASKLQSMEAERRQKKQSEVPVVRRLLTSPKKSRVTYNARPWHNDPLSEDMKDPASQPNKSAAKNPFDTDFGDDAVKDDTPPMRMRNAPKLKRVTSGGSTQWDNDVTKVSVARDHKPLFQVVRHVKQAHECQESGETQEFNDELNYIMEGLSATQSSSVRALSCSSLAQKCTASGFRMHLRAHGVLDKVFHELQDANENSVLALCTATVMYLVSRDRLVMDLEKGTLQLMLRVLSVQEPDSSPKKHSDYSRMREKMRTVCDTIRVKGRRAQLDPGKINPGELALESLLSLTGKKAGDWFKEDMRQMGGLDHIVDTVSECTCVVESLPIDQSDETLDQVRKVERCLRVLENVTYMNSENQNHLISYESCCLIKSMLRVLRACEACLKQHSVEHVGGKVNKDSCGYVAFSTVLASLRVLINLTHDNEYSSTKIGQLEGVIACVLSILLRLPQYVPPDERFDLLVLGLGLLINLVEHCQHNRDMLLEAPAVCPFDEYSPITSRDETPMHPLDALTKMCVSRYEAAKRIEVEHDEELDRKEKALNQQKQRRLMAANSLPQNSNDPNASGMWKDSGEGLEWVVNENHDKEVAKMADADSDLDVDVEVTPGSQEEEENFTKALHKAGRHMEDCIMAAYVALLIGCIIQGNSELIERVRDHLPEGDFEPMCRMLRKFLGFMNFTATEAISQSSGSKSILRIIDVLEAC